MNTQTTSILFGPLGFFLLFVLVVGAFLLGGFFIRERKIKTQMGQPQDPNLQQTGGRA